MRVNDNFYLFLQQYVNPSLPFPNPHCILRSTPSIEQRNSLHSTTSTERPQHFSQYAIYWATAAFFAVRHWTSATLFTVQRLLNDRSSYHSTSIEWPKHMVRHLLNDRNIFNCTKCTEWPQQSCCTTAALCSSRFAFFDVVLVFCTEDIIFISGQYTWTSFLTGVHISVFPRVSKIKFSYCRFGGLVTLVSKTRDILYLNI